MTIDMNTEDQLESTSTFITDDDAVNLEENEDTFFNYFHKSNSVNRSFFMPEFFNNIYEPIKDLIIFKNKEYEITISFKKYALNNISMFVPKINVYSKTTYWKYLSVHPKMFYIPTQKSHHGYRTKINAIVFSLLKKLLSFNEGTYDIFLGDNLRYTTYIEIVTKMDAFLIFPFKSRKHITAAKFFS